MALINNEFNAHLKAHAGLSALVGSSVFPIVGGKDQDMPAVVYRFDKDNETDLSGAVVLERFSVTVNVVAKGAAEVSDVSEQVEDALNIINGNLHNTAIQLCKLGSQSDSFDDELDAYVFTLIFTLIP